MSKLQFLVVCVFLTAALSGCASKGPLLETRETRPTTGVYYEVRRGDTLWKISKLHDVSIKEIVSANRLPDATKINVGQRLFIPSHMRKTVSLAPTGADTAKLSTGIFAWPVAGKVTSYFGSKKGGVANKGIDIEAREGSNIVAADGGIISFADDNVKGLGKTIIIDHENGFSSVYAHNSEILVKAGQRVKKNQLIARLGKTGRAEKPYLHFEVREGHEPRNPFYYLP